MNNFDKIKSFDERKMIKFLNYIIDEGNHALADDLEKYDEEDNGSGEEEVKAWIHINSLESSGW